MDSEQKYVTGLSFFDWNKMLSKLIFKGETIRVSRAVGYVPITPIKPKLKSSPYDKTTKPMQSAPALEFPWCLYCTPTHSLALAINSVFVTIDKSTMHSL